MKRKYQVAVTETFIGYVDCEAESLEEAVRIAEKTYRKPEKPSSDGTMSNQ